MSDHDALLDLAQFVEQIIFAAVGGVWLAWGVKLWAEFIDRYIGGM